MRSPDDNHDDPGKPSRATRGGGSSGFKWEDKLCGLPHMQGIVIIVNMIIMIIFIIMNYDYNNDHHQFKSQSSGNA